jgi:hypothetical protein
MSHLIPIIEAIEWTQKYVYITYPSLSQTGTCDQCDVYEADVMTKTEIYNTFDYLEDFDEKILPHVHPNCKCELHLIDIEVPGDIKKLPDESFNDWLSDLLSAGYIGAAVYDLIIAKRKKKKEAQTNK